MNRVAVVQELMAVAKELVSLDGESMNRTGMSLVDIKQDAHKWAAKRAAELVSELKTEAGKYGSMHDPMDSSVKLQWGDIERSFFLQAAKTIAEVLDSYKGYKPR